MSSYPPQQPQPPFPGQPLPAYGQPQAQFGQFPQPPSYQAYNPRTSTERAASVALGLAILSFAIPVVPGIIAFFLGAGAKRNIKASNGLRSGVGVATAAELMGAATTFLFAVALAVVYFVTSH